MLKAVLRYAVPLTAAIVVGPLTGRLIAHLPSVGGEADATPLTASPLGQGLLGGAAVAAGGVLTAVVGTRLIGPRAALAAASYALGVAAWFGASPAWLWREQASTQLGIRLVVEGVVAGLLILGVVVASGVVRRTSDGPRSAGGSTLNLSDLRRPAALVSSAAGAAAACAVAWLVAQDTMRGQALFAAFLGGIAAGVVARMVAKSMDEELPAETAFLAGALAAVVAPILVLVRPGVGTAAAAVLAGNEPGLIHLQGLDWAAGVLLGVPVGMAWAGAHVETPQPQPARAPV
jgi:hypothetical protein